MRVALLDSDIIAYAVAANSEENFNFAAGGGVSAKVVDKKACWRRCDEVVAKHADAVKADTVVICLSDPDRNFRKELDPTYKANRTNAEKPELLMLAKEYLFEEYRSYIRPRLEADDVMGILATRPALLGKAVSDLVIVSEDKDMRTVPAKVYNPNYPDLGVQEISDLDAKRFHMWQTIVGDPTDGYPGCPGVGAGGEWSDHLADFDLGPRAYPFAHDALLAETPDDLWDCVLGAYASKGLTEDDAIHQARLARILWADDYNFKTKRVRLWNPTKLFW